MKRQKTLEKQLSCEFIRINPDENDFNIFKVINEIHGQIKKLTKKLTKESTKKSFIDELSNKLLTVITYKFTSCVQFYFYSEIVFE